MYVEERGEEKEEGVVVLVVIIVVVVVVVVLRCMIHLFLSLASNHLREFAGEAGGKKEEGVMY